MLFIVGAISAFDMRPQAWVGVEVAVITLFTQIVRNKRGDRQLTKTPLVAEIRSCQRLELQQGCCRCI